MNVRSLDEKGGGEQTQSRSADPNAFHLVYHSRWHFCSGPADAMWELHNPTTRGGMLNSITTGDEVLHRYHCKLNGYKCIEHEAVAALDVVDNGTPQPSGSPLGSGGMTLASAA